MGRYISTTGTAGVTTKEVSSNFNATVNDRILADSSSASFEITLPASASLLVNDTIQIIDATQSTGSNSITIGRNGALIQGTAEDLTFDISGGILTLIYVGPTYGWIVGAV